MMKFLVSALLLMLSVFSWSDKTIYLTSLDWPPYSGKTLKDQGASIAVAKAAFKAMGYDLQVDFYPWSRAVNLAESEDNKYAGYFPEYYSADIAKNFIFSEPMGNGPLGFVENVSKPVTWNHLKDLSSYSIGVVQDYVNTQEFDEKVASGEIKAQTVISDKNNMLKVAHGRIDLAVVDKNVMAYLFATDNQLQPLKDNVQFNRTLLEDKKLYICFKKSQSEVAKIFNEGVKKINVTEIMNQYLN